MPYLEFEFVDQIAFYLNYDHDSSLLLMQSKTKVTDLELVLLFFVFWTINGCSHHSIAFLFPKELRNESIKNLRPSEMNETSIKWYTALLVPSQHY